MSISSYRHNVAMGYAGCFKPVCYPAAIEQVSPKHFLTREAYEAHQRFVNSYHLLLKIGEKTLNAAIADTTEKIVGNLANLSLRDIEFRRANSPTGFKSMVEELVQDGYGVVVETVTHKKAAISGSESHSIGLIPVGDDWFRPVSNRLHYGMGEGVTLDDVYDVLFIPELPFSKQQPYLGANITALPTAA